MRSKTFYAGRVEIVATLAVQDLLASDWERVARKAVEMALQRNEVDVHRAVEAVASGAVTPSEAKAVLRLLGPLRAALINQTADRETENVSRILGPA